MPYLTQDRREEVTKDKSHATTPGDWNYLFTVAYAKVFLSNVSYKTIHLLRKASRNPNMVNEVARVEHVLAENKITVEDRDSARDLAFLEFYDRVARYYEDFAKHHHGDVYQDVLKAIDKKYNEALKKMGTTNAEPEKKVLGGKHE